MLAIGTVGTDSVFVLNHTGLSMLVFAAFSAVNRGRRKLFLYTFIFTFTDFSQFKSLPNKAKCQLFC
ncbi:hypothetical protein FKG94_10675 [Exilibacterium tricleocarpae]|uniref:Uncharacterized protein n=1 Tax=Exilibacterium tricleocarpae TaxID=2591008 RepID=A0A545TSC5_9GAMM|nr:hypothetical protein [Exilibacterium tricleocarpae]TQV80124.1 hypothetical protein FKG94_10675 [Exilibacterium tricleocarpae]